jgi:hypothetical protein
MTPKFKLLDKVRIKDGSGYPDTQFIINAITYNSHVGLYLYYGVSNVRYYEDELELII